MSTHGISQFAEKRNRPWQSIRRIVRHCQRDRGPDSRPGRGCNPSNRPNSSSLWAASFEATLLVTIELNNRHDSIQAGRPAPTQVTTPHPVKDPSAGVRPIVLIAACLITHMSRIPCHARQPLPPTTATSINNGTPSRSGENHRTGRPLRQPAGTVINGRIRPHAREHFPGYRHLG